MLLKHPKTGQTARVPDRLTARYLRGGWTPTTEEKPAYPSIEDGWSIADTLDWVNGEQLRARIALAHELSRGVPRVTLVDQLRRLVASVPTEEE